MPSTERKTGATTREAVAFAADSSPAGDEMGPGPLGVPCVSKAFERSVAVVLGVNTYNPPLAPLHAAVSDAEAISELLADDHHGFKPVLLRDREVTVENVRAHLKKLAVELTERDRLLFYFAGHGEMVATDGNEEGFLLFADANQNEVSTYLSMVALCELLNEMKCRHMLIVLDCCHAGSFRWPSKFRKRDQGASRGYNDPLDRLLKERAWQVLVSAGRDETALDAVRERGAGNAPATRHPQTLGGVAHAPSDPSAAGHSPFARAFLRVLGGADADCVKKDGVVDAVELESFVEQEVRKLVGSHQQSPELYKIYEREAGEFLFEVPKTSLLAKRAPELSPSACPYRGPRPYDGSHRSSFFGRKTVVDELVKHVEGQPLTLLVGTAGVGKSSLLAAGLAPTLRERGWTVVETRLGEWGRTNDIETPRREGGSHPGAPISDGIRAWMANYPDREARLCIAIDAGRNQGAALSEAVALARALQDYGNRLRVVIAARPDFARGAAVGAMARFCSEGSVFRYEDERGERTRDELREIIEQPAAPHYLTFDPPGFVDTLIDDVAGTPLRLPLLSIVLEKLYARCLKRLRAGGDPADRALRRADYVEMGGLEGALAEHAGDVLKGLEKADSDYRKTARRVFLRMLARDDDVRGDDQWRGRSVGRDELEYGDDAENRRVQTLLDAFEDAHLIVAEGSGRDRRWRLAHDGLVRKRAIFEKWCDERGYNDESTGLRCDLVAAAKKWQHVEKGRRRHYLWGDRALLRDANQQRPWLNAHERKFIDASARERKLIGASARHTWRARSIFAALALTLMGAAASEGLSYWQGRRAQEGQSMRLSGNVARSR